MVWFRVFPQVFDICWQFSVLAAWLPAELGSGFKKLKFSGSSGMLPCRDRNLRLPALGDGEKTCRSWVSGLGFPDIHTVKTGSRKAGMRLVYGLWV